MQSRRFVCFFNLGILHGSSKHNVIVTKKFNNISAAGAVYWELNMRKSTGKFKCVGFRFLLYGSWEPLDSLKYSPGVRQHFPHQAKPPPGFWKIHILYIFSLWYNPYWKHICIYLYIDKSRGTPALWTPVVCWDTRSLLCAVGTLEIRCVDTQMC